MKCLNCGNEMEQGTVEGYAQGGDSSYEFISNRERQKKGIKGLWICSQAQMKKSVIHRGMSFHVETVVLLSQLKQKPDDYINVTIELDDMDITSRRD